MKTFILAAVSVLALGIAAAAAQPASPPAASAPDRSTPPRARQCILVSNINNYATDDAERLYIRVGVNRVYRLDLFAPCPELPWATRAIGIRSFGGSSWICDPIDAEIIVRNHGFHDRCQVTAITELTPEQVKALPKRDQP